MNRTDFHGLLVLDKPQGITSRDAVDRALRWFPRRTRMGHTGTLDPLATGVLVLCLGNATRLTEHVQRMTKTYVSTFRLGATSDSDDADGLVREVPGAVAPPGARVEETLAGFLGTHLQVPPAYSAARVTGQRAYTLARQGEEVVLEPRPVTIYSIDILAYAYPRLEVEVRCGKGTYIRSIARDLGERLDCGGYVEALRRTRVGPFSENALTLDADPGMARSRLLPMKTALVDLPELCLEEALALRFSRGQAVPWPTGSSEGEEVGVFTLTGELLGVGRHDPGQGVLRPVKVLGCRASSGNPC